MGKLFFKIRPDILLIPVPNNPDKWRRCSTLKPQGLILSSNDIKEFKKEIMRKKLADIF